VGTEFYFLHHTIYLDDNSGLHYYVKYLILLNDLDWNQRGKYFENKQKKVFIKSIFFVYGKSGGLKALLITPAYIAKIEIRTANNDNGAIFVTNRIPIKTQAPISIRSRVPYIR
jgi:hypothetical protein